MLFGWSELGKAFRSGAQIRKSRPERGGRIWCVHIVAARTLACGHRTVGLCAHGLARALFYALAWSSAANADLSTMLYLKATKKAA